MFNTLGTMVSGTYEARPVGGTSGEVGFKTKVYGRAVGEETIEDLKKDSFVKSSFLNNTNCCSYVCSDDSGPLLWTSEARFEDDDKASGVATKITLKLRFRPKGCIVCLDEETGSNIPLHCLWPTTCIAMVIMLPCIYLCNQSTFEAGYSQQRAMVSSLSKSHFNILEHHSRTQVKRRVNAVKAGIYKGFTSPPNASFFPTIGNVFGGLPGMMNGMMGATAQQHHMQRIQQGGSLFGGNAAYMQQMQMQQQMNGMQMNGVQMNQVPVATATAVPVVQTTTAVPVTAVPVETTPENSSANSSAPPKSEM